MRERGHHTVYLGMAPGVGKTYRALDDLRRARDGGRDAAIALLETHGRAETAARAEGLQTLPRRTVDRGGIVQGELDLPGLLAWAGRVVDRGGRPLAMIDELAHSNAPGLEHEKRWQDVETALEAGIDVLSTVNVQHLESLNDQVARLTGVRVRETVPDRVLVEAEDVIVIDLPPAVLLQRLRDGQIYPPERIPAALNNFFRIERLTALRETALLQAAEEVGARRVGRGGPAAQAGPPVRRRDDDERRAAAERSGIGATGERRLADDVAEAVQERLLVLVSAGPGGQRVLRRAWRSARRLHARLDALHVQRPGHERTAEEDRRLDGVRRLAAALGVELLVEEDDAIEGAVERVAAVRGTTYVFLGAGPPARGWRRLREPLPMRLVRRLPGVDVRIVADRGDGLEKRRSREGR